MRKQLYSINQTKVTWWETPKKKKYKLRKLTRIVKKITAETVVSLAGVQRVVYYSK